MLLSIRHRFAIGDRLLIQQHEGKILRLTSRVLMLMTLDGNHLSIPNSTVFKSIVCNYTRNPRRRFDFAVGIGPGENPVKVRRIGTETLRNLEGVMDEPPPSMRLEELGDWSVQVKFYGWVDQERAEFLKVRSEAIRLVKAALDEEGVEMPEPTWQVHLLRTAREPKKAPLAAAGDEVDVTRDTAVDDQIREDLARDGETLLE